MLWAMMRSKQRFFPLLDQRLRTVILLRHGSKVVAQQQTIRRFATADPSLVDDVHCPQSWKEHNVAVYPNVIDASDQAKLEDVVAQRGSRLRYQRGHWDDVILDYREFSIESEEVDRTILEPIRAFLDRAHKKTNDVEWLPSHVIDLKRTGQIHPHVDSTRFSGDLVCGVSLVSTAIMRLELEGEKQTEAHKGDGNNSPTVATGYVDLLLPPGSLYVLQGDGRYLYTHELRPDRSVFAPGTEREQMVHRDRRISIILRDAKKE